MTIALACVLCGAEDDVKTALLRFVQDGRTVFDSAPRCRDHQACRARTLAAGELWPEDEVERIEAYR